MRFIIILLLLAFPAFPQSPESGSSARLKFSRMNNRHALPRAGLVAAWDLTSAVLDPAPTTFRDISGNGNTLTLAASTEAPTVTTSGLSMDGSNDYAQSRNISLANAVSFMLVLYPTDNDVAELMLHNIAAGGAFETWRNGGTSRMLRGYGITYVTGPAISANAWSSHGAVISGTSGSIYANGALAITNTVGEASTVNAPITVGRTPNAETFAFGGTISAIPIYNRALTPAEMNRAHRYLKVALAPMGVALP